MVDPAAKRSHETSAHLVKHVCFRLHGQELAIDIAAVKETIAVRPLTRVFLTPPHIAGIMNLRGDIVAVLDLARRLGLGPTAITGDTRIVVCRPPTPSALQGAPQGQPAGDGGEVVSLMAGILADELTELRTLDMRQLAPPPLTLPDDTAALLIGVTATADGAPLQVLDMARLLESERLRAAQHEAS